VPLPFSFLHDVLVPHQAFQIGLDRIEYFLDCAPMPEPEILAVLGPPGSGKSRLLETVSLNHRSVRTTAGKDVPIIRVSVPSKPTIKGLGDLILKEIDPDDTRRYTENEMTRRIQVLMRECGTKMLMLDEFQHFFDRTSKKVWHHVTDWLKVLIDAVGCVLVISGLPDCTTVIKQCPQFRRRCRQKIVLPQFTWLDEGQQSQFKAVLTCFWQAMVDNKLPIPDLREEEWAFRIFCASGGLIGYLKKFLTEIVIQAGLRKNMQLQLNDFGNAYKRFAITFEDLSVAGFDPFQVDLKVHWTDAVETYVNAVGVAIPLD
jgi:Bacterial TniB protein